jgi:hypothetical protein
MDPAAGRCQGGGVAASSENLPHITLLSGRSGLRSDASDTLWLREGGLMTIIEQRKHQRYPLVRQPVGEFRLQTPTATYPIEVINDISSSGMRIYLDINLTARLQVAVEYIEPSLKLEVNGMVAWCAARMRRKDASDSPGRFVIGIQLLSPMLLMAMSGTY